MPVKEAGSFEAGAGQAGPMSPVWTALSMPAGTWTQIFPAVGLPAVQAGGIEAGTVEAGPGPNIGQTLGSSSFTLSQVNVPWNYADWPWLPSAAPTNIWTVI